MTYIEVAMIRLCRVNPKAIKKEWETSKKIGIDGFGS